MDRQAYLFYFNSAFLWTIFRKIIRTIGPSDYWAFGISDNWSFGLLTLRTIGLLDYRAFGRLGLRTIGPSDHRADTNWKCRFNSQTCFHGVPNSIILWIHCESTIVKSQIKICRRLWLHCVSWYEYPLVTVQLKFLLSVSVFRKCGIHFLFKPDIRLNTDFQTNISLFKTMFTLSNIKKI